MIGRRSAVVAALALASTLGVACSSDESNDSADTSEGTSVASPDPTDETDGTDGTDGTVTTNETDASSNATEPADTATVPAVDGELSAETCSLLIELHEFNEGFNDAAVSRDFDRLQQFDAENAPRALEIYDELSTKVAGRETDIAQARQLAEGLSAIIAGASSIDEVTSAMFALPDLNATNDSTIALDELAVERCAPT